MLTKMTMGRTNVKLKVGLKRQRIKQIEIELIVIHT